MLSEEQQIQLDRFLDDQMSAEEQRAFTELVRDDAALGDHVELQQRINSVLQEQYAGPETIALEAPMPANAHRRRTVIIAAAAVITLGVSAAFVVPKLLAPPRTEIEKYYAKLVRTGFVPTELCETDEAFTTWVRDRFETTLSPMAEHAGVEFLGWNRTQFMSAYTGVLLSRVLGEEVIVLIDRERFDREAPLSDGSGLHLFRKQFGPLVTYELTPHSEPAVLNVLQLQE